MVAATNTTLIHSIAVALDNTMPEYNFFYFFAIIFIFSSKDTTFMGSALPDGDVSIVYQHLNNPALLLYHPHQLQQVQLLAKTVVFWSHEAIRALIVIAKACGLVINVKFLFAQMEALWGLITLARVEESGLEFIAIFVSLNGFE